MPQSKVQGSTLGNLLKWEAGQLLLRIYRPQTWVLILIPVYDELGGEEEDGDDDEDIGDQPSNICIHIIGRSEVT